MRKIMLIVLIWTLGNSSTFSRETKQNVLIKKDARSSTREVVVKTKNFKEESQVRLWTWSIAEINSHCTLFDLFPVSADLEKEELLAHHSPVMERKYPPPKGVIKSQVLAQCFKKLIRINGQLFYFSTEQIGLYFMI